MAECTPDLSSDDCKSCQSLWATDLPTMCYGWEGGLVIYNSSYFIQYTTTNGFNNYVAQDPAPSPAPVTLPHNQDNRSPPAPLQAKRKTDSSSLALRLLV